MSIAPATSAPATSAPATSAPATSAPATSAPATRVLLAAIGLYRVAISPLRPPACRYLPSCSEYAVDALHIWGFRRGSWLALRRLSRCHPWHAGGHDPVPSRLAAPLSPAAG